MAKKVTKERSFSLYFEDSSHDDELVMTTQLVD